MIYINNSYTNKGYFYIKLKYIILILHTENNFKK